MKTALFVPLAFVAGVHGFALFAPYLALFLAAAHVLRGRRHRRIHRAVPVNAH